MKPENFQALARLARITPGSASYTAAKLHLLDGVAQNTAAETLGITPQTVSKAVAKIHRAELDALRATR